MNNDNKQNKLAQLERIIHPTKARYQLPDDVSTYSPRNFIIALVTFWTVILTTILLIF